MMSVLSCVVLLLLSVGQQPPKTGKIETVKDAKADFASFTTYKWERGYSAYDPEIHKAIVDTVDAELTARGLRKVETGAASVTVRYHTVVRTDVNLETLAEFERAGKAAPAQPLGRLVIVLRDPNNRQVWAADTVQKIDGDRASRPSYVAQMVVRMFEAYPTAKK
jgi:hypothetical protein